jgi:hypothetical protein
MKPTRTAAALGGLALATCCPTLWLQVTKTDPAPWQEVPTPAATAPTPPATMPNRFDVLAHGKLERLADGYQDAVDPRDDKLAQQTRALTELEGILARYGNKGLTACAPDASINATVNCTHRGQRGPGANCNALIVDHLPPGAAVVIAGGQARVVGTVDTDPRTGKPIVVLGERIDAADGQPIDVCFASTVALSRPLLSFVHMTDIQLRDPSVVLTDRKLSKRLDWFERLSSFEYDEDLAFYNQYLFEATVATINAAAGPSAPGGDPERPSFVIHTGDSIDAGVMSELRRFHRVIDRLRIPFFELFGNHDLLVFGNLTPIADVAKGDDGKCVPVASLIGGQTALAPNKICVDVHVRPCATCTTSDVALVAATNGHAATRKRFTDELFHQASQPVAEPADGGPAAYCGDTHPKIMETPYSRAHGFDLGTADDTLGGERLGYYAFVQRLADGRQAVFVALDSEDLEDFQGGNGGHIGHAQLAWLQRVLRCVQRPEHAHDLVFVFAHQPLSLISVDPADARLNLEDTLRSSDNVVAYLFGHNHEHAICGDLRLGKDHRPTTCTRFWEIETASLVEFPQEARMVRIKQVGQHLGFLEVSTFGEELADRSSQMARYVSLARRGAERDHCVTHNARCSEDKRPYRTDGNSTSARLFFRLP